MEEKIFKIIRVAKNPLETLGIMLLKDKNGIFQPVFTTLELPWRDNEVGRSCIADGQYRCSAYYSRKFDSTFIVTPTPGRSGILFHAGNSHKDTNGCILLGKAFKLDEEQKANRITDSLTAMGEFRLLLKNHDDFKLTINTYNHLKEV